MSEVTDFLIDGPDGPNNSPASLKSKYDRSRREARKLRAEVAQLTGERDDLKRMASEFEDRAKATWSALEDVLLERDAARSESARLAAQACELRAALTVCENDERLQAEWDHTGGVVRAALSAPTLPCLHKQQAADLAKLIATSLAALVYIGARGSKMLEFI